MSNQNEFQYIEAKEFLHLPVIEISDVKSFIRFANANQIEYIFKMDNNKKVGFFFPLNSIVYKIDGRGFETLLDMQLAQNGNFHDAKEYYEAKKDKILNRQEYVDIKQTGNFSKEDYDAANNAGFKEGFEKFKLKYDNFKKGLHTSIISPDIDNPVKLHQYALQKDIKNYLDFEKIYDAGFPDMLAYNDAESKGFTDAINYYDAHKRGFSDPAEYNEAKKQEIGNKKEYDEYNYLKNLNHNRNYRFDQLQLLIALSNCDNGKIISISEARKLLQDEQEKLKKRAGLEGKEIIPLWYTRGIDQENQMKEFLKNNQGLKKFGFFNTAKNSFEIFKASAVKILVDGSNVAYNGKAKPDLNNIRAMIKELKFWKFENIIVLVDASLRHQLKSPGLVKQLINELKMHYECHESPSKRTADEFLISTVKKEKCLVVTNDEFKDWKKTDKWITDNYENIRVPFRILGENNVILSGIDKLREKPVEA